LSRNPCFQGPWRWRVAIELLRWRGIGARHLERVGRFMAKLLSNAPGREQWDGRRGREDHETKIGEYKSMIAG
jgi:hypothetical protein